MLWINSQTSLCSLSRLLWVIPRHNMEPEGKGAPWLVLTDQPPWHRAGWRKGETGSGEANKNYQGWNLSGLSLWCSGAALCQLHFVVIPLECAILEAGTEILLLCCESPTLNTGPGSRQELYKYLWSVHWFNHLGLVLRERHRITQ